MQGCYAHDRSKYFRQHGVLCVLSVEIKLKYIIHVGSQQQNLKCRNSVNVFF